MNRAPRCPMSPPVMQLNSQPCGSRHASSLEEEPAFVAACRPAGGLTPPGHGHGSPPPPPVDLWWLWMVANAGRSSQSLQVVLNCMVCARNLTKCGKKGKYVRQAALNSLMVGRCAGAQGLGGPYNGGRGGRLTRNTRAVYIYFIMNSSAVKL